MLAALLAGIAYVVIGRVPVPAAKVWRLAAWLASGVVFAAHIGYEHYRLRSSSRATALHTALAVAIGGFGLAVWGMMRSWSMGTGITPLWLFALVAWPAVTAIPAFLVALVIGSVLTRYQRSPAP